MLSVLRALCRQPRVEGVVLWCFWTSYATLYFLYYIFLSFFLFFYCKWIFSCVFLWAGSVLFVLELSSSLWQWLGHHGWSLIMLVELTWVKNFLYSDKKGWRLEGKGKTKTWEHLPSSLLLNVPLQVTIISI